MSCVFVVSEAAGRSPKDLPSNTFALGTMPVKSAHALNAAKAVTAKAQRPRRCLAGLEKSKGIGGSRVRFCRK